jgi:hypothetical protein
MERYFAPNGQQEASRMISSLIVCPICDKDFDPDNMLDHLTENHSNLLLTPEITMEFE